MRKSFTIAVVSAFPPGIQTLNEYGYHFIQELLKRDDVERVIVLADKLPEHIEELNLGEKCEVKRLWKFNNVLTPLRILHAVRKIKPNCVIYNVQTASFGDREIPAALGLMTPMITSWFGYKSGVIAHNIISGIDLDKTILKGQKLRQTIVKFGGKIISKAMVSADYITVTLESYFTHLHNVYPKADITHVPHGTFNTGTENLLPLKNRPRRIVTMGKFGTYKRLETLLEAFDIIRKNPKYADYELIIGGTDHPNTLGYVNSIKEARKDDPQVNVVGYVAEEDVSNFFGEAQLSVFDYNSTTGSSGVLHQTASYGTVPIFPNIGDFVDVCKAEGINGYHYQPESAIDMAKAKIEALSNIERAQELVLANRAAAQEMPLSNVIEFHINKLAQGYPSV
jgi:glycosyltransferase involved in cell wall biosynthesis